MKKSVPNILNFNDLFKEYSETNIYNPKDNFVLKEDKYILDVSDPSDKRSAVGQGGEKRKNVLEILEKNKKALDEIEDAMLEFVQHQVGMNPKVYIARTKDIKTDIEYFTAKTFYPLKGGKRKEVKIYLGKAEQYGNNTKSVQAKSFGKRKMTQTIARRIREGSL